MNEHHPQRKLGAGSNQAAGRVQGQNFFDGWSNFKRLKNNEPPLVVAYSSPMRIKLTSEVQPCPLAQSRTWTSSCCPMRVCWLAARAALP